MSPSGARSHGFSEPALSADKMRQKIESTFIRDCIVDAGLDNFYKWTPNCAPDFFDNKINNYLRLDNSERRAFFQKMMDWINQQMQKENLALLSAEDPIILTRAKCRSAEHLKQKRIRPKKIPKLPPVLEKALTLDRMQTLAQSTFTWPIEHNRGTVTSLRYLAEAQAVKNLAQVVDNETLEQPFTCGSKLEIDLSSKSIIDHIKDSTHPPIHLDWRSRDGAVRGRTGFPNSGPTDSFQALLDNCREGPPDLGNKSIVGHWSGRSWHLQAGQFNTDFCPYQTGIVDNIENALLKAGDDQDTGTQVVPELRNLNIYSIGGFSIPQVYTPLEATHFGSLVVSLPIAHQGGFLKLEHGDREMTYDWSNEDASYIQWAAFVSWSRRSLSEVEGGHRVELVYKLHTTRRPSPLSGAKLDFTHSALTEYVRVLHEQPGFFPEGAVFGIFCSHWYSYDNKDTQSAEPRFLKGKDLSIFTALKKLGVKVGVHPVLEIDKSYGGSIVPAYQKKVDIKMVERSDDALRRLEKYAWNGYHTSRTMNVSENIHDLELRYEGELISVNDLMDNVDANSRHKCAFNAKRMRRSFNTRFEELRAERRVKGLHETKTKKRDVTIGLKIGPVVIKLQDRYQTNLDKLVDENWPHVTLDGVYWLNNLNFNDPQIVASEYGTTSAAQRHSTLAMIFVLPPTTERFFTSED